MEQLVRDLGPTDRFILCFCIQHSLYTFCEHETCSKDVFEFGHRYSALPLLLNLVLPLLVCLFVSAVLHKVESKAKQNRQPIDGLLRKVSLSDQVVVHVFDGEVGEQASVGELVACDVDFKLLLEQMNVVLAPLLPPLLRLEAHWERACHLHRPADGQQRSGDVVEETQHFVVQVD